MNTSLATKAKETRAYCFGHNTLGSRIRRNEIKGSSSYYINKRGKKCVIPWTWNGEAWVKNGSTRSDNRARLSRRRIRQRRSWRRDRNSGGFSRVKQHQTNAWKKSLRGSTNWSLNQGIPRKTYQYTADFYGVHYDFHGVYLDEALFFVKREIVPKVKDGQSFGLIVGKGLHSRYNAVLKPNIMTFLEKENISVRISDKNTGLLIVTP